MNMKRLEECFEPGFQDKVNKDLPPSYCGEDDTRFTKDVDGSLETKFDKNEGLGIPVHCDPVTTGKITNDPQQPGDVPSSTIFRYAKGLRGTDEAVVGLFKNVEVIDVNSKVHQVPIIWGSQERAVAALVQENVRKDKSLVVDRIRLPIMSIYTSDHTPNNDRYLYHGVLDYRRRGPDRKPTLTKQENRHPKDTVFGLSRGIPVDLGYTLTIWTRYWEDMNQILEQIYLKFSGGIAYIKIQGVNWETIVRLDSVANNVNTEPGDRQERILKFQINMTAETFIPQPIARRKSVLRTKVDIVDGIEIDEIQNVINKIEEAVEGLEE